MRAMQRYGTWAAILVTLLAACAPVATPTPKATATPVRGSAKPTGVPTAALVAATPTQAPEAKQASGPRRGGVFHLAHNTTIPTWDSMTITTQALHGPISLIYDRPQRFGGGPPACKFLPPIPSAVETWKWVDSTTFEMRLRQGLRFHNRPPVNGREATAQDLAWTINKLFAKTGLNMADLMPVVDRAEAIDKYTARIYLKRQYATLPERLVEDHFYLYAPEAVGEDLAIAKPEEHIGTGPFMFKSEVPGVNISLERAPDYWEKGLPYVDEFNFKIVPDASTRAAMFRAGQLDMVWREPTPISVGLAKTPGVTVQKCPDLPVTALALSVDRPPFDNVLLRRAVAMAIDYDAMLKSVFQSEAVRLYAPIPYLGDPWYMQPQDYPAEVRKYLEYNPEEAKKLVAQAGYPQGLKTQVNYITRYANSPQIAEALNAMLAKVGITLELKLWDSTAFGNARTNKALEGMSLILTSPLPTAYGTVNFYHSTEGRGWYISFGMKDQVVDEVGTKLTRATDPKEQEALVRQLQARFADQQFQIAMPAAMMFGISQPWVKSFYFQPLYLYDYADFMYAVWLDK